MKAKEYFERLSDISLSELQQDAMKGLEEFSKGRFSMIMTAIMIDLFKDIQPIAIARKATSNSALEAVIREQRDKWEAVCRMVEKKYGTQLFSRQTFNHAFQTMYPDTYQLLPNRFWR